MCPRDNWNLHKINIQALSFNEFLPSQQYNFVYFRVLYHFTVHTMNFGTHVDQLAQLRRN